MIRKFLFIVSFCLGLVFTGYSQLTKLYGLLPEYAGDTLAFYSWTDAFTSNEVLIGKGAVAKNGEFSLNLNIDKTRAVHIYLGIYRGEMILEPGASYSIKFPPKEEKKIEDELNPFFEAIQFYIGLDDTSYTELNNQTRDLDQFTNYFLVENQTRIAQRKIKKEHVDRFVTVLDSIFPDSENAYFNDYKFYRIGHVRNICETLDMNESSAAFFQERPVLYTNDAYFNLFNQVYTKFLPVFVKSTGHYELIDLIQEDTAYTQIKSVLSADTTLSNEALKEMVLMKLLYEGFYANRFDAIPVMALLDSLIDKTTFKEHRQIAKNMQKQVGHLLPDSFAPDFSLYNVDSTLFTLEEFRGKYVYLNFCNNSSYTCQQEYELLKALNDKFSRHLEIVSISTDKNFRTFVEQMYKRDCSWTFIHYGNQPDILKDYKVRIYPSYFLIDPYGKILVAPALSPSENFENAFHRVLNKRT